jgi:hypothetical protein
MKLFTLLYRSFLIFTLLLVGSNLGNCQTSNDCSNLATGTFYSYPKNSANRFVTYRQKDTAKEFDLDKGDSTLWKVDWKDNCSYTLKYMRGSRKLTGQEANLVKNHELFYTIKMVTDNYYVFNGYIDNAKGFSLGEDTMWLNEKVNYKPSRMFERIPNLSVLKRANFSDTSKYALVYMYRPDKFTNSLGQGYPIWLDGLPLATLANREGFIFKVFQPGSHKVSFFFDKTESFYTIDFFPGKVYYLKSWINWNMVKFKPAVIEMKQMPMETGKKEFEQLVY